MGDKFFFGNEHSAKIHRENAANMFSAGMDMADMAWEVKCQEEDMKQRALENERHAIEDARRSVDEKHHGYKVGISYP